MCKLGFSLQTQYDLPMAQLIPILKQAGFSAISPLWSPELPLADMVSCAKSCGISVQSLHAPHKGIALLWNPDDPLSAPVQEKILGCIDACAEYNIPIMVVHPWQGLIYTFPDTPLDFRSFDRMMEYAGKKGVCVAFENLEGEEYLQALMERYPQAGFCWDSGHDHCYPHKTDFLEKYGNRLIMTHLNDNWGLRSPDGIPSGDDDLHFLPFDGNLDWNHAMDRLKSLPKQDILNFEIKTRSHSTAPEDLPYAQLSVEEFIALAGIRAKTIADKYTLGT